MSQHFFGEPWARVEEDLTPAPTPVGQRCRWCKEVIVEGDQGIVGNGFLHHKDCYFRVLFGGVNHQIGRCHCCGGNQPADPVA
jgi:hypothetical protein